MKVCPICSSTYDDKVDFCFQDGAPLVPAGGSASTVSPSAAGAVPVEDAPTGGIDAPDLPPWARAAPESDPTELPASPLKPR
ncbi:MAG: hypothetical protein VX000_14865, partial [Myxococcota bacterium]|nr:hypothetical protein [Myxococcota bacterium]